MSRTIRTLTTGLVAGVLTASTSVAATAQSGPLRTYEFPDARGDVQELQGNTLTASDEALRAVDISEVDLAVHDGRLDVTFTRGGNAAAWSPDRFAGGVFAIYENRDLDGDGQPDQMVMRMFAYDAEEPLAFKMTVTGWEFQTTEPDCSYGAWTGRHDGSTTSLSIDASCFGDLDFSQEVDWYAATGLSTDSDSNDGWSDHMPNDASSANPVRIDLSGMDGGASNPPAYPTPVARDVADTCDGRSGPGFSDTDRSVHRSSIDCIAAYGITQGKGDGTYDPSGTLTYGQTATFLKKTIEAAGSTLPAEPFDACEGRAGLHEPSIEALAEAGIISPATCGLAGEPITRDIMAMWTDGAISFGGATAPSDGTDWYRDDDSSAFEVEINRITSWGVVTGKGGGLYGPSDTLTRGQMATFLARALDTVRNGG